MLIQLELFENLSQVELLEKEIILLKQSQDKLRKALFARHGELAKKYMEVHERLDILEMHICKNNQMKE